MSIDERLVVKVVEAAVRVRLDCVLIDQSGNTTSMKTATVSEHLAHYREIADEVAAGTSYTITRKGKPWLMLTPAQPAKRLSLSQKQKRLASYSKRPTGVVDALIRERQ